MSTSSPTSTQPGWYDDPETPEMLRWFDGAAWSPFTKDRPAAAAPAVPQPRPAPHPATTAMTPRPAPSPAMTPRPAPGPVTTPRTAPGPGPAMTARPTPAPVPAPRPDPAPAPPTPPFRPALGPGAAGSAVDAFTVTRPVDAAVERPPTALRRLVGRLAENLPGWLPEPVAEPWRTRLRATATRTDRLSDTLTAANLRALVLPAGSAWQGSVASCLGVLTILLSVWPVAGLVAWAVTCAFAAWALLRIRRDVLLGGRVHAWFGVACGVGPLWTGLLMVAYR